MEKWEELGQFKTVVEKLPEAFKHLLYSAVEVFTVESPSPPRLVVIELNEEGKVVIIQAGESTAVASVYYNKTVHYQTRTCLDARRTPRVLKLSWSETGIRLPVSKWRKTLDEKMKF